MNDSTFYYVLRADVQSAPSVKHPTYGQAETEAKRLCKKHGAPFVIMKAVALVRVQEHPVEVKKLDSTEDISDGGND